MIILNELVNLVRFTLVLYLFVLNNFTSSQNCSTITEDTLESFLYEYHPATDDGPSKLVLLESTIVCLTHAKIQQRYAYTTVIVKYMSQFSDGVAGSNETHYAIIDIGCGGDNEWDIGVLGSSAMKWMSGYSDDVIRRSDCRICDGSQSEADQSTHCVACPDECRSVVNSLQGCYPTADDGYKCCLLYSNGLCSDKCEDNQSVTNESFICTTVLETSSEIITSSSAVSEFISPATYSKSSSSRSNHCHCTASLTTEPLANLQDFPTYLHLTFFMSAVTFLVTVVVSVSLTITIIVCFCSLKLKHRSNTISNQQGVPHAPVEAMSSLGTISQYIEPLSSPMTTTDRSLGETVSTQFNSSYRRSSGRYTSATGRVPAVQYEDPERVLDERKRRKSTSRQPSLSSNRLAPPPPSSGTATVNNDSYITIIA